MPDLPKDKNTLKNFGYLMGGVFSIITAFLLYKGHKTAVTVLGLVAGAFFFSALIRPRILSGVYILWMKFADVAGRFNSKVILSLMYTIVFTLVRGLLWVFRKELLQKKIDSSLDSYWSDHEPVENDPKRYEKQF